MAMEKEWALRTHEEKDSLIKQFMALNAEHPGRSQKSICDELGIKPHHYRQWSKRIGKPRRNRRPIEVVQNFVHEAPSNSFAASASNLMQTIPTQSPEFVGKVLGSMLITLMHGGR